MDLATPSVKTRYVRVNGTWPTELPKPTPQEAVTACKRLYRKFRGRAWRGKWQLTSGRRHTWPRHGVFYVNPDERRDHGGGWPALVHSMSHLVWRQMFPRAKTHAPGHAHLEREMIEHVIASGWLDGKLRREPRAVESKPDPKAKRYAATLAAITRWQAKQRRATVALRKLRQRERYYQRTLAAA